MLPNASLPMLSDERKPFYMIYLDNSATTRVCAPAVSAMQRCMTEGFFNPSALYAPSMDVEKMMTACRDLILKEVHAPQDARVVFVSGGTEADNLAVLGGTAALRSGRVLYSAGEHPAVREACLSLCNVQAEEIPLARDGRINLERLEEMLDADVKMICIMQVNNETGAIMPIRKAARLRDMKCPDALLHVDGVQGFLRVPFDMKCCGADSYALSGHKIHAPKGIGALVMGGRLRPLPRQIGGGQERTLRSGTENTPGIAGLKAAMECYPRDNQMRVVKLMLYASILSLVPEVSVNGPAPDSEYAAPHIINLSLTPVRSETMLHALEGDKIYVGIGSACSSQKQKVSRVLTQMGVTGRVAESALRFSLCPDNTAEEMAVVAQKIKCYYDMLKKYTRR